MASSKLLMKGVMDEFLKKYPKAVVNEKDLEFHMPNFHIMEQHLGIQRILARAVTVHIEEDGSFEMKEGLFTYHWMCFLGVNSSLEVCYIHHRPNPTLIRKREHIPTKWNRYQLCKKDWQVCQDEIDAFKISKKYFIPMEDEDLDLDEELMIAKKIMDFKRLNRAVPGRSNCTKRAATWYIEQQFEELLDEYQSTHNHYHLARADFYRKLSVNHMDWDDIILCAMAYEGDVASYLIQKRLRMHYTEKIGSI